MTIAALLRQRAERHPERSALCGPLGRRTYGELLELAQRTRGALSKLGIARGDRVLVATPEPMETALAFLAISPSAVVAPVHPFAPAPELVRWVREIEPRLVIAPPGAAARALGIPALSLRELTAEPVDLSCEPEDLALLLSTSGTTGRPQWVPLTHRNVTASAANIAGALALSSDDVCLDVMPHHHVQGLIGALLATLESGGTSVSLPFSAAAIAEEIETYRPTWITVSPAMLRSLLGRRLDHRLRFIRCTSAPLSPRLADEVERELGTSIIVGYGMTETASQITSMPLGERREGSVGRTAGPAGPEVRIEDGEILVRGPTVMRGYWRQPARAEEWLRTGDLGRLDEDGFLFVTGRIKELINRGGEKIAPAKIEAVIAEDPAVLEVIAHPIPDEWLGEEIGVAVVPALGAQIDPAQLRERCARVLSDFEVPRHVAIVPSIPRTPAGKPIRRPGEVAILEMFREVLRNPALAATDDFFRAGGDSVQALSVAQRLGVGVAEVFRASSARELAEMWAAPGEPVVRRDWSSAQEQLIALHRRDPRDPGQHVSRAWKLPALVERKAIELALERLLARHQILRACLLPVMRFAEELRVELSPISVRAEELADLLEADLGVPFGAELPPVRFRLYELPGGDRVLQTTLHHALTDDRSMEVFEAELAAALDGGPALPAVRWDHAERSNEPHVPYWRARLAEIGAPPALPNDGSLSIDASGELVRWPMDRIEGPLRRFCREEGITPFTPLVAASMIVLERYSGRGEACVGVLTSGRGPESMDRVGLFANLLPLRSPPLGDQSFLELCLQVRDALVEAHVHEVPFAELVRVFGLPPFNVTCTFRRPAPARLERLPFRQRSARFDLAIDWIDEEGSLSAEVVSRSSAISPGSVERMRLHLETLLLAALADPSRSIAELPLLSEPELRPMDGERLPIPSCEFHQLVERRVRERPDAIAVEAGGERLCYAELWARAEAFPARPGDVIPTEARGIALPVEMLAVLRAGAAFLPLDRSLPASWQAEMRAAAAGNHAGLAYVLFTSGSTGRSKGVMVEHRSLVALWADLSQRIDLGPADVVLSVTTPAFDIALVELLFPLASGAKVVIAPEGAGAAKLAELIDSSGATVMQATPSVWRALIAAGWRGSPRLTALSGGEELTPDLAARLLERTARLFNLYGPTEATIWATCDRVRSAEDVSIGRPFANVWTEVLDEAGRRVPIGVPGELYLGGACLARGYLGDPELTTSRFVQLPRGRAFRTGDRVARRADGRIRWIGRKDDQIKIRGARVEPAEIDRALRYHPEVRDVAVIAGERALSALLVLSAEVPPAELRRFLRHRLPDYMIPSRILPVERIPRLHNGKVDPAGCRSLLERPGRTLTSTEEVLAAIWKDLLGAGEVSAEDDFFQLGGHSLLITELLRRIREAFALELPPHAVFDAPVISELAALVERGGPTPVQAAPEVAATMEVPSISTRAPRSLLLTGATGFVGAFLLAELANRGLELICLVRAETHDHARARLRGAFDRFRIDARALERCRPVPCDLDDADLSLALSALRPVDAVVHAAARVDFLRSERALERTNVLATRALLEWASERGGRFHLISTMAAAAATTGYARSKLAAERVAASSVIYRLGTVTPHSRSGAGPDGATFARRIASMRRSRIAPLEEAPLHLIPVDRAARAIAARICSTDPGAAAYDVASLPIAWSEIIDWMELRGFDVERIPRADWLKRIETDTADPLHPLVPALRGAPAAEPRALEPLVAEPFQLEWLAPWIDA